jgi:hypothetical protein
MTMILNKGIFGMLRETQEIISIASGAEPHSMSPSHVYQIKIDIPRRGVEALNYIVSMHQIEAIMSRLANLLLIRSVFPYL